MSEAQLQAENQRLRAGISEAVRILAPHLDHVGSPVNLAFIALSDALTAANAISMQAPAEERTAKAYVAYHVKPTTNNLTAFRQAKQRLMDVHGGMTPSYFAAWERVTATRLPGVDAEDITKIETAVQA